MRSTALNKLSSAGEFLLGLLLLAVLVLGIWWILSGAWSALSSLDKRVFAALITGLLVASGAIWVKRLEHRHSVEAQFRDAKVNLFNDFIGVLDEVDSRDISTEELALKVREWKRKTLFWGGPKVMHSFLSLSELGVDSKTVEGMAQSVEKVGKLILAMRKDVGLSNRGLVPTSTNGVSKETIMGAHYMLRHPNLFLACLVKDPSMQIEILTALEAAEDAKKRPLQ